MLDDKRIIACIPARMASTRLPHKPLLRKTGKYLLQHVYERIWPSDFLDDVLIATDSDEIAAACRGFGARAVMTSPKHQSGTDRIAEATTGLVADVIVNVQGDEPLIDPASVKLAARLLVADEAAGMATLCFPIDAETARDPNVVKVVADKNGRALYFSRSKIPFDRGTVMQYYKHIGLYAFRPETLARFSALPVGTLEEAERLEQLRALENGIVIAVGIAAADSIGIDTPDDYEAFVKKLEGE